MAEEICSEVIGKMNFLSDFTKNVLNWVEGIDSPPYNIEFLLGDGCNQNCRFCGQYNNHFYGNTMKENRFYEIINEAADMGVKKIILTGDGEPFFNKNKALKMMELIKKHGMYGTMDTNGTLFTEEDIKKIVEIGWDDFSVSIQGPDAKTHDYLVNLVGSFNRVIKNIELFNKWKERLNVDNPEFFITTVLTNRNFDKMDKMIDLASRLRTGFRIMSLIICHDEGRKLALNNKQEKYFKNILKILKKNARKKHIKLLCFDEIENSINFKEIGNKKLHKILIKDGDNKFLSSPCYEPWIRMLIDSKGIVSPCGRFRLKASVKHDSVKKVWFGNEFQNIRNCILNKKIREECDVCCEIYNTLKIREELKNALMKK